MTKKTVKELDTDLTHFKEEFNNMKEKFEMLVVKYETLEDKFKILEANYKKCQTNKNEDFKCSICAEKFKSVKELRNHRKKHENRRGSYQCEQCEKCFNEDWKLSAHNKTHKVYSCNQCTNSFKYEELKDKHVKIAHENVKLFCHFFNNYKDCPYEEKCLFLHEPSGKCKYGKICERTNCMFEHENEYREDEISDGKNSDDIFDENGDDENSDDENGDEDNESMNSTFFNPLVEHVEENETDENNEKTKYQSVNGRLTCRACKQYAFMCNC